MADEEAAGQLMRGALTLGAIFGAPLALAVLGLIGLVGALLADGLWDGLGAGLLGASLAVMAWARLGRRRQMDKPHRAP